MRPTETFEVVGMAPDAGGGEITAKVTELSFASWQVKRAHDELPVSMALIDPKPLTRQAITEMLAKAFPDCATIAAASCEELLGMRQAPHLVIVYVRSWGVEDAWVQNVLRLVRLELSDPPVAIVSDREDADEVVKALDCGVRGYIPTSILSEVAFAALSLINAGGIFIPVCALRLPTTELHGEVPTGRNGASDELDLTPRELSVIDLLRKGKPNKMIAAQLNLQESTVKVHVRNILKKLHADNRTQAASVANRLLD